MFQLPGLERRQLENTTQLAELRTAAEIPANCLSFGVNAKTMNGLVNLIDLRTESLKELSKRIDEATLPNAVSIVQVVEARHALAYRPSEFTALFYFLGLAVAFFLLLFQNLRFGRRQLEHTTQLAELHAAAEIPAKVGKPKPLNADSACTRAVALALVVMKTANATAARECADNLAQRLVFIAPDELLKSTRSISSEIKAYNVQFVFEQVCERLLAESPNAKSKYKEVAQTISSLVPQDGKANATNVTGPKVIRTLCRVLNS